MKWAMIPVRGMELVNLDEDEAKILVSGVKKALGLVPEDSLDEAEITLIEEFLNEFDRPMDY